MPSLITAPVRVLPLVAKYLRHQYSCDPFLISADGNPYAAYLWACLDRYPDKKQPASYRKLTSELTVGTSHWLGRHGFGSYLSPTKVITWNNFVKQAFMHRLVQEVAIRESCGQGVYNPIRVILDRYGLEETELSFETAVRYYSRNRPTLAQQAENRTLFSLSKNRALPVVPDSKMVA